MEALPVRVFEEVKRPYSYNDLVDLRGVLQGIYMIFPSRHPPDCRSHTMRLLT
ncbi:uncharacterized protein LAESUDRAFT_725019 [Laetiporus sulphureus 93-53]|uniref:Uncharacterized protein n=1 Tax=Laetiporus sulphureus 93-53 TaxID=1314785 RepID=A0A165EQH7_9APHY|nr:uncharacterized protein LAESUDRAFT_725019 [Laetiporus sulphureus 93-53]KZT07552.1 hypothetical protein LAESUDRAFT_725019 [Laetiporus sulphureus 93-53]